MTGLLLITGALLLVSGGVKVRASVRARAGVGLLTALELLAGVAWGVGGAAGAGATTFATLAVPFGVALVLVSSTQHAVRTGAQRRRRAQSEARRLENYVKYLHGADDPPAPDG